jgi:hypothetical protein
MIRLSYSALSSLLVCERKFQLERLLTTSIEKQDYPATVLGKSFGAGVQSYLIHQDPDKAIFDAYLAYTPVLEEPDKGRTEEHALSLLLSTIPHLDNLLQDWEVATFNDKPAVELSFRLNIDEAFYYVGYLDVVLRNKWSNKYAVGEIKSTSLKIHDLSPLYQNSGQALGYSIILDSIVGEDLSEYDTIYLVGQLNDKHQHQFKIYPFPKTLMDRLNWFISLSLDVSRLHSMLDNNVFPMRGSSCLQYMRPCPHFGTCSLHGLDIPKVEEPDENVYDFTFSLDEVVANHLERINR